MYAENEIIHASGEQLPYGMDIYIRYNPQMPDIFKYTHVRHTESGDQWHDSTDRLSGTEPTNEGQETMWNA